MKTGGLLLRCAIAGGSVWNASALAAGFGFNCETEHSTYVNYDTKIACTVSWSPPPGQWDLGYLTIRWDAEAENPELDDEDQPDDIDAEVEVSLWDFRGAGTIGLDFEHIDNHFVTEYMSGCGSWGECPLPGPLSQEDSLWDCEAHVKVALTTFASWGRQRFSGSSWATYSLDVYQEPPG